MVQTHHSWPFLSDYKLQDRNYLDDEAALDLLRGSWEPERRIDLLVSDSTGVVTIKLFEHWGLLKVTTEGGNKEDCSRIEELFCGTLHLVDATDEELQGVVTPGAINQRVLSLKHRIEKLQSTLQGGTSENRLRCFVSFRFDEHSKALAFELREFLELAGLQFISGLGYEPRSVSAKVLKRLKGQIDLVVVFSSSGDSAWLHQEIGVAKGRGLPVMVLKEAAATFDEALLSDTE